MNRLYPILGRMALAACIFAGWPAAGLADTYPERPVRLVVPFAPGGAVDTFARLIGPAVAERLGQQVIIDNRAGAGGTIGTAAVASARPDGYTALLVYDTYAVAPLLYPKLPYDPGRLAPVSLLAKVPLALLAANGMPGNDLKSFLAHGAAKPGGLNFSSGGPGSSGHLTAELLGHKFGLKFTHVPYKGGGPALNAVLAQEVDFTFLGTLATAQHVRGGRAKAIAVMGDSEVDVLPGVPTIAALGHADLEVYSWYGILVPAGTPSTVVERLRDAIRHAMADPEISRRLKEQGGTAVGNTPAEFGRFIDEEAARWQKVIQAANIVLD